MNLNKIREEHLEEKMTTIVNDTLIICWNEQDIISTSCVSKVSFLSLNYTYYFYLNNLLQKESFTNNYTREELFTSIIHPKIIHFEQYSLGIIILSILFIVGILKLFTVKKDFDI